MRVFAFFNTLILYVLVAVMALSYYIEFVLDLSPCSLCILQRFFMIGIGTCLMLNISGRISFRNTAAAILSCVLGSIVSLYQWSMLLTQGGISYAPLIFSIPIYIWATLLFFFVAILLFLLVFFMQEGAVVPRNLFIKVGYVLFLFIVGCEVVSTYLSCGPFLC